MKPTFQCPSQLVANTDSQESKGAAMTRLKFEQVESRELMAFGILEAAIVSGAGVVENDETHWVGQGIVKPAEFQHILPYMEQENLWKKTSSGSHMDPLRTQIAVDPSDPSGNIPKGSQPAGIIAILIG